MRAPLLALAAAALLLAPAVPAEARTKVSQVVHGRLVPTDAESDAKGTFRILVQKRGAAAREFLYADAWGLDATPDDGGNLPDYHLWLSTDDGSLVSDFGSFRLTARGRAKFRFHSARQEFPEGIETLAAFGGGTIEVRLGDAVVMDGAIPEFVEVDGENGPGSGARAKAVGIARLHPTDDGGRGRGILEAVYANRPREDAEAIKVFCWNLHARPGSEVSVVCVDGEGAETRIGTMIVRSRARLALLRLSTRKGDEMPGGGVLALAGQKVEVRDADGVVHLEGTFPDLLAE